MMKKSRKGMTLIEIVISIAIYGILALLLVEIMTLVNSTIRATDALNKRLAYEGKFADNQLTAGLDPTNNSESATISIDYGTRDATTGGVAVSAAPRRVRVNDATVWTADYTDALHSNIGAQANFRFMVIGRNAFIPSTHPSHPFYVELKVDSAIWSVDSLQNIVISGAMIDADFSISGSDPQTIIGTPTAAATPADPTATPYTEASAAFVIPASELPTDHTSDFTIRIPVNYHFGAFPVRPAGHREAGNPYLDPRDINVAFNMRGIGEHSGNAYDYNYVTLTLSYVSCWPDKLPDGTETVNYFEDARYTVYGDGTLTS